MLLVRLGGIGYGWNGGLKYRSSKEELHCSYDVIHWIRIIQMQVWLDDSLPMVNMILERHRKACKEHDIVLHLRELLLMIRMAVILVNFLVYSPRLSWLCITFIQ